MNDAPFTSLTEEEQAAAEADPQRYERFFGPLAQGAQALKRMVQSPFDMARDARQAGGYSQLDPRDVGRAGFDVGTMALAPAAPLATGALPRGSGLVLSSGGAMDPPKPPKAKKGPSKVDSTDIRATAKSWRDVLGWADRGGHIKRSGTTGKYSGAPEGIDSPQALGALRKGVDKTTEAGALGGDWYDRARGGIAEAAGPDPNKRNLLSYELAATSPQATPDTNFGFALQGHNDAVLGAPRSIVRTGQTGELVNSAAAPFARSLEPGHNGGPGTAPKALGKKTGMYSDNINPNITHGNFGTNDTWHARVFGFENPDGAPFSGTVTQQMHGFLDGETALAANRMNEKQVPLGPGKTVGNWAPANVQAAAWVEAKARGIMQGRPGMTYEQAFKVANDTYLEGINKRTAFATHEAMPGESTGHLAGMTDAQKAQLDADPRSTWATSNDGRDAIYEAAGLYNRPTLEGQGYYRNNAGQVEMNRGQTARPLVSYDNANNASHVSPHSAAALTKGEALRAYVDAQEAGAWHKTIDNGTVQSRDAVRVPFDRTLTKAEMAELERIGKERGYGQPTDTGQGVTFKDHKKGAVVGKDLKKQMVSGRSDLRRVLPGSDPQHVRYQGGYVDYDWSQPGSGTATRQLLERLDAPEAPAFARNVGQAPAVKQAAQARLERDTGMAAQHGLPVREDIQNARSILAKGGIEALRAAIKAGAVLPAAAAVVLDYPFATDRGDNT